MKHKEIEKAVNYLKKITRRPDIVLLVGSGLSSILEKLSDRKTVPYAEIPNFPRLKRNDQQKNIYIGNLGGKRVVALGGRFHYYNGHTSEDIAFPLRVLREWGVNIVLITNAAGSINTSFAVGDFVLIVDHIDFTGRNPLMGENYDELGPKFPDMSEIYDRGLIDLCLRTGNEIGLSLKTGVYIGVTGPSYETPAEIKAFRLLGADLVGMSTVPETIIARHMNQKVLAISTVTNQAAGNTPMHLSHQDVIKVAGNRANDMIRLLTAFLQKLDSVPPVFINHEVPPDR